MTITVNPAPPVNKAPTANAGPDQTVTIAAGQSNIAVTLNGSGSSDSDGSIASYTWTGSPNPADVVSPTVNLTAGSHTFTLVVTDDDGETSAADTVTITVNPAPPVNKAPTANAGPDQTVTIASGQSNIAVTLNGSGSSDADGSIASYTWTGSPNPADVVSPTVNLTAGSHMFTLVVTDDDGETSAADTVTITVNPAPPVNKAPTANAGPDQTVTIASGQSNIAVTLNGSGSSDADGSIASYTWTGSPNPADVVSPTVNLTAGSHTFTLVVTDDDGETSAADTVTITVNPAPPVNQAPTADVNGPYSGTTGVAVSFSSAGSSDSDGTIATYDWNFGDGATAAGTSPSHTYAAADTYTVTLTVTDDDGETASASTTAAITDPVACTSDIPEHCSITAYTGPEVCVECHQDEARDMHGSVHYQQGGAFPNVTNIPTDFASAGERPAKAAGDLIATGINTYCGAHENSPRFTCAGCHVGNGRFPMAQSEFELLNPDSAEAKKQLANIDCLMCHQDAYKRFPDWTSNGYGFTDLILLNMADDGSGGLIEADGAELVRTGFAGIPDVDPVTQDFQFLPAGSDTLPADVPMPPMTLTTLEAAQTVHRTTRKSCLNCHAGAAGANGAKRGDLSKENEAPSVAIDMHMSPSGADLTCADCHGENLPDGTGHRVRGRGLDLRPNDTPDRFSCENSGCHSDRPHGDYSSTSGSSKDKHAQKIACQTCHIPSYAKADVGTEVARDWQDPHPSASACNGRGGWLPREDKGGLGSASLIPSYAWFDGTSEIYYLGESLNGVPTVPLDASVAASFVGDYQAGDPAYVIGMPNGDVDSTSLGTKLYPMKEHWGKLARNDADNTLVGHSTFEFFRTGSFCRAVAVGLGIDEVNAAESKVCDGLPGDMEMPSSTSAVPVHTYQTINHGVETSDNALGCNDCHGNSARMDLMGDLGYQLKGDERTVCTECHGWEGTMSFTKVHDKHVKDKRRDCSACHTFSRPERGLRK